ncbi:unnamed protein product [Didymodactylos carnosus]|uniref:Uncharacterized protein n=1 Tax=Didymodactylos carnosus TaxID=1234261 RepID=A0A815H7S0_9BILA|nr:unnamed protein product [Didymodactylos carnosus]CAF4219934.1 unnamed protein product [Didymodactylos carnosus]
MKTARIANRLERDLCINKVRDSPKCGKTAAFSCLASANTNHTPYWNGYVDAIKPTISENTELINSSYNGAECNFNFTVYDTTKGVGKPVYTFLNKSWNCGANILLYESRYAQGKPLPSQYILTELCKMFFRTLGTRYKNEFEKHARDEEYEVYFTTEDEFVHSSQNMSITTTNKRVASISISRAENSKSSIIDTFHTILTTQVSNVHLDQFIGPVQSDISLENDFTVTKKMISVSKMSY